MATPDYGQYGYDPRDYGIEARDDTRLFASGEATGSRHRLRGWRSRRLTLTRKQLALGMVAVALVVMAALLLSVAVIHHSRRMAQPQDEDNQATESRIPKRRRHGAGRSGVEPSNAPPFVVPSFSVHNSSVVAWFLNGIKKENIRSHIRFLASQPHLSGTGRSEHDVVDYIYSRIKEYGFDSYQLVPYRVLHQYPDPAKPNKVQLLGTDNEVLFEAQLQEQVAADTNVSFVPAYLAYSAQGSVQGELVYVNYGRYEDFDVLDSHHVKVAGHICLIRFGQVHRGEKVRNCYERGGIGAILFTDPGASGQRGPFYPKSMFDSATALQRGSLYTEGDPETPGYPSIEDVLRESYAEVAPQIPAQVMAFKDARMFLRMLDGPEVFPRSGLNFSYRTGPFKAEHKGKKVRLEVNNRLQRPVVYNVIGVIKGGEEPNRYTLTGNHHDAWTYGAVDPSSGTAALLEMARVLGAMRRQGWRPRRTIVFGFWAAEEMAIAGSREWVEDRYLLLNDGAVGYINVDSCTSGPMFLAYASPSLRAIMYNATRVVPDGKKSLYDTWVEYEFRGPSVMDPPVRPPHGGSDNAAFNFFVAVPSGGIAFRPDRRMYGGGPYVAYHTGYETLHLFESYIDPDLSITRRCAQLDGVLTLMLAETEVVPYDLVNLGLALREAFEGLESIKPVLESVNANIEWLREEIQEFMAAARDWHDWIGSQGAFEPSTLRTINDRMMLVERAFIKPEGLVGRPTVRHLAFGPQLANEFAGKGFPSLHDLAYYGSRLRSGSSEQEHAWSVLRRHVNDIALAVRAARMLIDPDLII